MISSVGPLGTALEQSSDRSTSCAISRSVAVGRVIVAWLAVDSTFSIFSPSDGEGYWYATDTAGNIYSTIASFTDNRSFHGSGAQIVIAITQVRNALTTSDTIDFNANAGLEPGFNYIRAISIEEFDFDGDRWAVSGSHYQGRKDTLVQPGAIGKTFGVSREWLLLHGLGLEGPIADTFSWDSDYTQIVPIGSSTGNTDDDITVHGGYRIATLSTDTVSVTNSTSSSRDSSQVLVGVCAVPQIPGFPVTPILDDFNRADENPLSGGWDDSGPTAFFGQNAQLLSNRAAGSGGSWWDATFDRCVEVYAEIAVAGESVLTFHGSGDTSIGPTMDGNSVGYYQLSQNARALIHAGRSGLQGFVGSEVLLAWAVLGVGDKYGMQRTRGPAGCVGVNHVWVNFGGAGWEEIAAYILDPGDNNGEFTTGRLALAALGSTVRLDNFGGGQFPCGSKFIPQLYRREFVQ